MRSFGGYGASVPSGDRAVESADVRRRTEQASPTKPLTEEDTQVAAIFGDRRQGTEASDDGEP